MATKIADKSAVDAVPSAEWNWLVDLIDGTGVASANLFLTSGAGNGGAGIYVTQSQANKGIRVTKTSDEAQQAAYFEENTQGANTHYCAFAWGGDANRNTAYFYRNVTAANTGAPMVTIEQDHAADDQPALQIQQDSTTITAYGLRIDAGGGAICALFSESASNYVSVARDPNNANGSSYFYRDLAAASTAGPVVFMVNDSATDDQPVLKIQQDVTTVEAINFSTGSIAFDFATAMATSGAGTMAINNSPGAGATTWIKVQVNGTEGFIPVHYTV